MKKHLLGNLKKITAIKLESLLVRLQLCHRGLIIYLKSNIEDVEDCTMAFVDFMELEGATSEIY